MGRDRRYSEDYDFDEEEYERRRREYIRRKRLQKRRQIRRRKLMRLVSMAAVLVLVIGLAGKGISKLTSGNGKRKPTEVTTQVKADVKKGEIPAMKQPVMSAGDIEKMSAAETVFGWQEDKNGKWYRNSDGTFYQNGWRAIDGVRYYFDDNGYAVTGWLELDGEDYYFDSEGRYDSSRVRPMVALTFDDGPGKYTEELLDCLEANNAKATFYMLGQNVEQFPEIAERIKNSGMEVGNHTYGHEILTSVSKGTVSEQIEKANDAIEDATGEIAVSFRPPGGSVNKTVQNLANMPIIKWSIDTKDWRDKDAEKIYQVVMDNAQNGSVVLMHDIHETSVQATIRMIPKLIEKGFKLVTVQELAEARGVELEDGEVYYYFGEGQQQVE